MTQMSDVLIKAEGVSKKFCRSLKKSLWYGVRDIGTEINPFSRANGSSTENHHGRRLREAEFWAVNDVSFELRRGECLGIIGQNGAGKTTLLKILNGLIKPDSGRIEIRGAVGALIALGAGFNPVLTGRENIYVNGSVLGLRRAEIDRKLDEIIAFAEIDEFIDSPVQSYSSGMNVRLGFAIATALSPDVLLLDEVLAVGDIGFRLKCIRRIDEMLKNAAVIFVSHDVPHVSRVCSSTLVMSKGGVAYLGEPAKGIEVYRALNEERYTPSEGLMSLQPPVTSFHVAAVPGELPAGSPLTARITTIATANVDRVVLRITMYNAAGAFAADCVGDSLEHNLRLNQGTTEWVVEIGSLPLRAGRYEISFSITGPKGELLALSYRRHPIAITGGYHAILADCQLALRSWTRA